VTGFGQPGTDLTEAEPLARFRARPPQPPGHFHGLGVHLGERFSALDLLAGGLTLALAGSSQRLDEVGLFEPKNIEICWLSQPLQP
jgi:hypothetical protein